jgi:hypothetical protein
LKKLFEIIAFFVIATTGVSNDFDIEKLHFLRGLDIPNTPSTYEMGFYGKNFEQLSPEVEKVKFHLVPFFHSSQKCIFPSKFETLIATPFLP